MPPTPSFAFNATVLAVHDGDTCTLQFDPGFHMTVETPVRIKGINAPEVTGIQRPQGLAARDYLLSIMPVGSHVVAVTEKDPTDKYGRWLSDIWLDDGRNVSATMIAANQAAPWDGSGPKPVPTPSPALPTPAPSA